MCHQCQLYQHVPVVPDGTFQIWKNAKNFWLTPATGERGGGAPLGSKCPSLRHGRALNYITQRCSDVVIRYSTQDEIATLWRNVTMWFILN